MTYKIAAYLRLSSADDDLLKEEKSESNSITNQRALIRHYLNHTEEFQPAGKNAEYEYTEYIDDGISGTTVEHRPAFLRMIRDARSHYIDCIIVKDFSRFSRESLVLGDYVEQIFPMIGIRFISINDHYDSNSGNSSGSAAALTVAMKALVNEYYVKDMSRKRSASVHTRMAIGRPIGSAPYGYRRELHSKAYTLDPATAPIVKHIFDLAIEGKRTYEICSILTEEGYQTPLSYNWAHPEEHHARNYPLNDHPVWAHTTVYTILRNSVYTGRLTMGKNRYNHAEHKSIKTSPDEHFITENAHPAIVSQEQFDKVQEILKRQNRGAVHEDNRHVCKQNYAKSPAVRYRKKLTGYLICAYCGKRLKFTQGGFYYICPSIYVEPGTTCPKNRYPTAAIEEWLLQQIKSIGRKVIQLEKDCRETYKENHRKLTDNEYKQAYLEKELENYTERKQEIYEALNTRQISLVEYQLQDHALKEKITAAKEELTALLAESEELRTFIVPTELLIMAEAYEKYQDADELTPDIIKEFLSYVVMKDGEPVEVCWKHQKLLEEYRLVTVIQNKRKLRKSIVADN